MIIMVYKSSKLTSAELHIQIIINNSMNNYESYNFYESYNLQVNLSELLIG